MYQAYTWCRCCKSYEGDL